MPGNSKKNSKSLKITKKRLNFKYLIQNVAQKLNELSCRHSWAFSNIIKKSLDDRLLHRDKGPAQCTQWAPFSPHTTQPSTHIILTRVLAAKTHTPLGFHSFLFSQRQHQQNIVQYSTKLSQFGSGLGCERFSHLKPVPNSQVNKLVFISSDIFVGRDHRGDYATIHRLFQQKKIK